MPCVAQGCAIAKTRAVTPRCRAQHPLRSAHSRRRRFSAFCFLTEVLGVRASRLFAGVGVDQADAERCGVASGRTRGDGCDDGACQRYLGSTGMLCRAGAPPLQRALCPSAASGRAQPESAPSAARPRTAWCASAAAASLRQPLWNGLTEWRLEASQRAENASAALASLQLASSRSELLLRRQHAAAVAHSALLRWYMGSGRPLTEAKLFEAVAQASAELAELAAAETSKAADPAAVPAQVAAAAPSAAPVPAALVAALSGGRADSHSPTERSAFTEPTFTERSTSPPPPLLALPLASLCRR